MSALSPRLVAAGAACTSVREKRKAAHVNCNSWGRWNILAGGFVPTGTSQAARSSWAVLPKGSLQFAIKVQHYCSLTSKPGSIQTVLLHFWESAALCCCWKQPAQMYSLGMLRGLQRAAWGHGTWGRQVRCTQRSSGRSWQLPLWLLSDPLWLRVEQLHPWAGSITEVPSSIEHPGRLCACSVDISLWSSLVKW